MNGFTTPLLYDDNVLTLTYLVAMMVVQTVSYNVSQTLSWYTGE